MIDTQVLLDKHGPRGQRGAIVLEVAAHDGFGNVTEAGLSQAVDHVHWVGRAWHCLVVVVVSDDPAFLAAFAHLSLRRHALRWSTRILVLTRLPLSHLGGLHGFLSTRNAMLLLVSDVDEVMRFILIHTFRRKSWKSIANVILADRVGMFMMMPYSAPDTRPFRVASWDSRKGLVLLSPLPLFPEKYKTLVCSQLFCLTLLSLDLHRFSHGPELLLAIQVIPHHTMRWEADSSVPEGRQLVVKGALDNIARYFSRALNFTIRYTLASGRSFGTKLPNGSWSGMMGLVAREEVDLGAAPIAISQTRAEAVDFTMPLWTGRVRIVSGRGELETDPWGFLLPLTPLVWSATLISLAVVCAALLLPSSFLPGRVMSRADFRSVRVLLQQGEASGTMLGPPAGECLAS
ncbi:uncharacterized protein LOC123511973 [Portunus trituberculatus]|uniref:uncharacterized protein LOC123511973 n=1 Tax=Portunus trituberculatus TaxID=210409 RepID=UPI001E1CDD6A|nr:uncharacterized protein LOC123511973 [Portunus trituberculatus]